MASRKPPNRPRIFDAFVDRDGRLSNSGLVMLETIWRQIVAGFTIVPVVISQASVNVLYLTPELNEEGGSELANGMAYWGKAVAASTGAVTAKVKKNATQDNAEVKVYKNAGAAQAGAGDIALNGYYLFIYHDNLDGGAGGFVLK